MKATGQNSEKKLAEQVRERFGVSVPRWRKNAKDRFPDYVRSYSAQEKAEIKALVDWVCTSDEYKNLFDVYFSYCAILSTRGYANRDMERVVRLSDWKTRVRRNFAERQVRAVYHDMCCDPATILGNGSSNGYWIYLDREWMDISHMKVGEAILNLDEVWAVIGHTLGERLDTCIEREYHFKNHSSIRCERCGENIPVHLRDGCRFDVYENLLHCQRCARLCESHWRGIDNIYVRRSDNG